MEAPKPTPYCCDYFKRMANSFRWMCYSDWPHILNMPHIKHGADSLRVNHCPSCGKDVRNIHIHKSDLE